MTRIVVATLNLCALERRWRHRRHLIVSAFLDAVPDLVSLQRVHLLSRQGRWLQAQINSRQGPSAIPYQLVEKRRGHLLKGFVEGVAILSRLPILSHDGSSLGYGGRVALRTNVALSSGHTLDFVATRLYPDSGGTEERVEQVMHLTGWLGETGAVPWQVIAGDFSETPGGAAIRRLKQGYRSAFEARHGREPYATFPTALAETTEPVGRCLDYIFVSPNIRVREARLFCDKAANDDNTLYASMHVGLLATLQIKDS